MPAQFEITCTCEFAAAHRLAAPGLTDEQNLARYGPCAREHGHTWTLEVTVQGPLDPAAGWVVDFAQLDRLVHERIVARADHRHLNHDVPFVHGAIPTAENLAVACWHELEPALRAWPGCRLVRIAIGEDRRHLVVYRGAPEAG
ncbi:MAG: 6-carboxytetrahydropterin synthase [Planctomycetes bacterium]|nr:6-carboxytetrahydropterin synthase [Planctomycetota bacterium]